jgi:plastocyanin
MKKHLYLFMIILGIILMLPIIHSSYADVSPVEAVILIKENQNKTVFYQPSNTTVKEGSEILIANTATSDHSVTSGSGPNDPMAGKSFDTDIIKPKGFVEYVPHNLKPGNYSFYSSTDPKIKGQLVVIPSSK